jgi:hypothetical protein
MAGMPALFEPLPLGGIALARGFLDDPRWAWHAAAALGADAVYRPRYCLRPLNASDRSSSF